MTFKEFRDLLVLLYGDEIISDEEFLLLYDMDSYLKCIYTNSLDLQRRTKLHKNPDRIDYNTVIKCGLNNTTYIYKKA